MKRVVVLVFIVCSFVSSKSQGIDTTDISLHFTLEQCLHYAFGNSYTREVMKLAEKARQDSYNQSKYERLPNLSGTLKEVYTHLGDAYETTWNGNYNLATNLFIYKGGAIGNTIEQNKLLMQQAAFETKKADNQLTVKILQSFLTALGNEELIKFQESLLAASEEQLRQGKAKYEAGAIIESDYLLLEAQYASDNSNLIDSRIAHENSLLSLKSLLSMSPLEKLLIQYPDTNSINEMALLPTKNYVLERAITTLPDLKISQYDIDVAKMGVKLARGNYLPTLALEASIGNNEIPNIGTQFFTGFGQQVSLVLSIPIYDNHRTRSKVTQSRIQVQQAELDKKQTQLELEQAVIQEYQSVVSFYNKYKASEISRDAYLKTYEAYRAKFNAGTITAVNLLQQQNNYISALNEFIQNKYGFILNRKILDVYMGEAIKM